MGLNHILLYSLSDGVPGLSDLGKTFQDFFVSLNHLCGSIDMGKFVIGCLDIFDDLMDFTLNFVQTLPLLLSPPSLSSKASSRGKVISERWRIPSSSYLRP